MVIYYTGRKLVSSPRAQHKNCGKLQPQLWCIDSGNFLLIQTPRAKESKFRQIANTQCQVSPPSLRGFTLSFRTESPRVSLHPANMSLYTFYGKYRFWRLKSHALYSQQVSEGFLTKASSVVFNTPVLKV